MTRKYGFKDVISRLFVNNAVPIIFVVFIAFAIPISGFSAPYLIQ